MKITERTRTISKKLSYILRHKPESIELSLDEYGWAKVEDLLERLAKHRVNLSFEQLEKVVQENDKQRFAFNEDQTKIRANQGHSIPIKLGYEATEPPEILFHGTATRFLKSIQKQGLTKQNRHHVHLSADEETAQKVGSRHGVVKILKVHSGAMFRDGLAFYRSENGVWLTDEVPIKYILNL